DRPGVLEALLAAGLDVARINFSHGSAAEHRERIARLRHATQGLNRPVAVLADLPGPKLRVVLETERELQPGQEVTLATEPGARADLGATEPELLREVRPGQRVLLDDGRLQLQAVRQEPDRLV